MENLLAIVQNFWYATRNLNFFVKITVFIFHKGPYYKHFLIIFVLTKTETIVSFSNNDFCSENVLTFKKRLSLWNVRQAYAKRPVQSAAENFKLTAHSLRKAALFIYVISENTAPAT